MTEAKFTEQTAVITRFVQIYCDHHHRTPKSLSTNELSYKTANLSYEASLCEQCNKMLNYAYDRLQNCPHDDKPKCRKCPKICYEKEQLQMMVRIMRYSGIKSGINRLKGLFLADSR